MARISKRIATRVVVDEMTGRVKTVTIERYRARYRYETGREHARHLLKKAQAQRWLDEVTASVVRDDYVDPKAGKITFRQWFTRWSDVQNWKAGTAETANMTLASVTFADTPMDRITQLHVEPWMKSMNRPGPKRKGALAVSTRRTRYKYVRMAFLAAVKARVIRQGPTAGITPPRMPKSEAKMSIPTSEQIGRAWPRPETSERSWQFVPSPGYVSARRPSCGSMTSTSSDAPDGAAPDPGPGQLQDRRGGSEV